MIPRTAIKRKINPAFSIKKLLLNSSEKFGISGSLRCLIHSFEEKRNMEKSIDKNIVNFKAKDFKNSSLTLLVKESDIKTDAAGVAGSKQLGSLVAEIVKKTNTAINQKNENSNNEFSDFFITLLDHLDTL